MRFSLLPLLLSIACASEVTDPTNPAHIASNVENQTLSKLADCNVPVEPSEVDLIEKVRSGFISGDSILLTQGEVERLRQYEHIRVTDPERNALINLVLVCIDWPAVQTSATQ